MATQAVPQAMLCVSHSGNVEQSITQSNLINATSSSPSSGGGAGGGGQL